MLVNLELETTNRIVIRISIKLILLGSLMPCYSCHGFHFCNAQSCLTSLISFSISSSFIAIISLETTSSPLRLCSSCKGKKQKDMVTLPLKGNTAWELLSKPLQMSKNYPYSVTESTYKIQGTTKIVFTT